MKYVISFPDPVYGYIRATEIEKTIIDLPEFQRLKRIKQLGLASVVFPGALYTRFEHCLGTMHIANLFFQRFEEEFDEKYQQKLRLAGLLHDIGHSPFSHTFEIAFKRLKNIGPARFKDHESNTRFIVSNLGKRKNIQDLLKQSGIKEKPIQFFKDIGNIATGKKEQLNKKDKFLSSIISGEIDADRIDYLLRDGLHTGVNFIGFDILQILENISMNKKKDKLIIGKQGEYRAFHERIAISLGEAVLTSRYHHYTFLVNHPRNIAANLMIIKALEDSLKNFRKKVNQIEYTKTFDKFFFEYDDNDFLNFIYQHGSENAKNIIDSYKDGKLFRNACDLKANALHPKTKLCLEIINQKPSIIDDIEEDINKIMYPCKIYLYNTSVKGIPKNLRVRIVNHDEFLYDESEIAAGLMTEMLGSLSLYFYCDESENIQKCKNLIKKNWNDIEVIIIDKINKERCKNPFQLDFLILFINGFYEFIRKKFANDNLPINEMIRYITRIYSMVKWIQINYNKKTGNRFGHSNYRFNQNYGFIYSPELFEDLMKLASIRLIKIIIEKKERSIYDFGAQRGKLPFDYIDKRTHNYYRLYVLEDGKKYCRYIRNFYPDYFKFISDNLNYLYNNFYIKF